MELRNFILKNFMNVSYKYQVDLEPPSLKKISLKLKMLKSSMKWSEM